MSDQNTDQNLHRTSLLQVTDQERRVLYSALENMVQRSEKHDRAKRRRLTLILLIVGAYVVFNLGALIYDPTIPRGQDYASVVRMDGPIGADEVFSAARYATPLAKAFEDERSKGVVLVINSTGGSPAQSQLIHDMIKALADKHTKRVIVVAEDYLASGAYLVAMAADQIHAPTTSFIGSIGVVAPGLDLSGFGERYGIRDMTFTAGRSKAPFSMWSPPTEEERAKISQYLTDIHNEFIRLVKLGRGDRIEQADVDLFTGEIWTGLRARGLGLIDGHLTLQQVVMHEYGVEATRVYKPKLGASDLLGLLF